MLEQKDYMVIKEKACNEIKKIRQRMESQNDTQKGDWEQLCLALKVYEKLLNVESMEQTGYSGYSRNSYGDYSEARGRGSNGRYVSRDNYSGGSSYYSGGNSYDNQVIEDMMRRANPQEREILMRMMR